MSACFRLPAQELLGGGGRSRRRGPPGMLRATQAAANYTVVPTMSLSLGPAPGASQATQAATQSHAHAHTQRPGPAGQQTQGPADTQAQGSVSSSQYSGSATASASQTVRLTARTRELGNAQARAIAGHRRRAQAKMAQSRAARAAAVTLYRRYRTGELPDTTSVRVTSFLLPLYGIAAADAPTATAALAAVAEACFLAEPAEGLAAVRGALAEAYAARPAAPELLAALQAVAARDGGAALDPRDVVAAAEAAGRYQAGALQLEQQLLAAAAAGGGGGDVASAERAWAAIAHLYGELDDQDVAAAARRRLQRCPGSDGVAATEAAGRARLALRRAGQLTAAVEKLRVSWACACICVARLAYVALVRVGSAAPGRDDRTRVCCTSEPSTVTCCISGIGLRPPATAASPYHGRAVLLVHS